MCKGHLEPFSEIGYRVVEPPIGWLMRLPFERAGLISLAAGFTDFETLPVEEIREICEALLCDSWRARQALQYGTTAGLAQLRELTASRFNELEEDAVRKLGASKTLPSQIHSEQVVICNGSQQMLYLLTEVLCNSGDIVIVEDPTYFVFLGIAQQFGLCCRAVRMGANGLDIGHLDQVCSELEKSGQAWRVKFLYMVSYYQNPTGRSTDFRLKQLVLERLAQLEKYAGHKIYLVEDAAYREMGYSGSSWPSALSSETAGDRVIYIGTYSKPFATGIRLGFGILPDAVRQKVLFVKNNHDFGSANFLQFIMAEAIKSGLYDRHLSIIKARYAEKAALMDRQLRTLLPPFVSWRRPDGGLYFWLELPTGLDTGVHSQLFRRALELGVLYVPGEMCYAEDPVRPKPTHQIRLSFGNPDDREIVLGVERLAAAIRSTV